MIGFLRVQLTVYLAAISVAAFPCFYGHGAFERGDKSQTDVGDIFGGDLPDPADTSGEEFRSQLADKQKEAAAEPTNLDLQEDVAYLTYMISQPAAAEKIYQSILATAPDRYSTLCSYATMLHLSNRFDEADAMLSRAIAAKPGFRSGAEELHLEMIRFQKKANADPEYSKSAMFIPSFTSLWTARAAPPQTFEEAKFPDYDKDGLAELLRQFPRFGDGWLVMAMIMEHEGNHDRAVRAYDRATKEGTGKTSEIRQYLGKYRIHAEVNDPTRTSGSRIIRNIFIVGGILLLLLGWNLGSRAYNNIKDAKEAREAELNRKKAGDGRPLK